MLMLCILSNSRNYKKLFAANDDFEITWDGTLVSYKGKAANVVIPDGVTIIGEYAFSWNENIKKVVIPNSVKRIIDSAFFSCKSLKEINIPSSVIELGNSVFQYCSSLEKIELPDSIYKYGNDLFMGCSNLSSVVLPDIIGHNITDRMFWGCEKLKSIGIKNIYKIGEESFYGCKELTEINLKYANSIGDRAFENCMSLKMVELSTELKEIPARLFYGCSNLSEIKYSNTVKKIGTDAFTGTKWLLDQKEKGSYVVINNILVDGSIASGNAVLPSTVKIINQYALYGNSFVNSIIIPDTCTSIGSLAFAYCENLMAVYIPPQVNEIKDNAFYGCKKLTAIYGKSGSFAEEYATKHGISFIASSSDYMKKAVEPATKKNEAEVLYEDIIIEIGGSESFDVDDSIRTSYDEITFTSLDSSIIEIKGENFEAKKTGTSLVLMEGKKGKKSKILKVYRITGIKSILMPENLQSVMLVNGLPDGSNVLCDLIESNDTLQVKLTAYDIQGKEKWSYNIKATAEDKNSNDIYKTIYSLSCTKIIKLRDGNILAVGSGRGRVTGKVKSQYNIVTTTWLTKLEANTGRVIWETIVRPGDSCHFLIDAIEKEDGSILIYEDIFSGGTDILHLDAEGNVVSERNYKLAAEHTIMTNSLVPLDDGRVLTVGYFNTSNIINIFSLSSDGSEKIVASIPTEGPSDYGTIGMTAPRLLKGNKNDFYIFFWGSSNRGILIHLDNEFNIIKTHKFGVGAVQNVFITENDKIVLLVGNNWSHFNTKVMIFDCFTETSSSILLSSYGDTNYYIPNAYVDVVSNQSIVVTGSSNDKKTYLSRIEAEDLLNNKKDIQSLKFSNIKKQKYTGKSIKPNVSVYDGEKKLKSGTDYTVAYYNNKKKGQAAAIILGKGNYRGVHIIYFDIVDKN